MVLVNIIVSGFWMGKLWRLGFVEMFDFKLWFVWLFFKMFFFGIDVRRFVVFLSFVW